MWGFECGGLSVEVRCGVRVRFSIVASDWLLILLRFLK